MRVSCSVPAYSRMGPKGMPNCFLELLAYSTKTKILIAALS